jgi:hypothetical protein
MNGWIEIRTPASFSASNVAVSNVMVLSHLAGYPVYVVNATTVKRKKHPKSPQFHDMNAVLELLKKTA